jgi:hypothetical protein
VGTPQSSRSLRGGLEALELCSVAVRTFFRSIDDWVRAGMPESDTPHANRARTAWAELLADLAAVVRTFGALLRAETAGAATAEEGALADALDRLRLDRVRHAEVLLVDPREHPDLWEVDGALITLVDRMLLELDVAAHAELFAGRRAAELLRLLRSLRLPGERLGRRTGRKHQGPGEADSANRGDQDRGGDRPAGSSPDDAPPRRPDGAS